MVVPPPIIKTMIAIEKWIKDQFSLTVEQAGKLVLQKPKVITEFFSDESKIGRAAADAKNAEDRAKEMEGQIQAI